ncbi:MAG: hypothetical protein FWE60_00775 [Oscillospiraceae bacterium]|nr:hypothetical protein [Oscillospiraceae bacterium]
MSNGFSIDDILAEVERKRDTSSDSGNKTNKAELDEILSAKPAQPKSGAVPGVTEILAPPPKKPEKPAKPKKIKPEKPEKTKQEKPVKIKKEKPEKPEKPQFNTGDIVFRKAKIKSAGRGVPDVPPLPQPPAAAPPSVLPPPAPPSPPSERGAARGAKGMSVAVGSEQEKDDEKGFDFPKLEITQVLEAPKPAPMDEALKKRGEALLERDLSLETPTEQIDALNPYDILMSADGGFDNDKTGDEFVSLLSGDTKGIADGDLKELAAQIRNAEEAGEDKTPTAEVVKTYTPASKPQAAPVPAADSHLSEKEKRSNTALISSLNKALKKKRDSDVDAYRTLSITKPGEKPAENPVTHGLNIDYKKQILTDTSLTLGEQHIPQIAEQKMSDLAGKRKRKIRDFVLEDIEDEKDIITLREEEDVPADEYDDYDTSGQIWKDLCETHKGLKIRFVILFLLTAFACLLAFTNDAGIHMAYEILGIDASFLDKRFDTAGFLYLNLGLGVLGALACSTVITGGFSKLFSGKGDCDSLCAVSASACILCVVPMLNAASFLKQGYANIFVAVGLCGLFFNTTGKLMMMARAKRNFNFVSGDSAKHYAEIIEDEQVSRAFTKGVLYELPVLCTMRKTEFLSDFLRNSYCNDKADHLSRFLTPAAFAAAAVVGLVSLFVPYSGDSSLLAGNIFWALTAATGTLCLLSPLSIMFLVNNPLLRASKSLSKKDAVVLGYNAAERFSKVNSVLVDASSLFPGGSVDFKLIKRCQPPNSLAPYAIDDALITAASLAIKSGSILTPMFYDVVAGKSEMLYNIDNCIYEVNMGISGWMGNKRIMLGNREQMKHHGMRVPDLKKEQQYTRKYGDVVYLASGGETLAMLFLKIVPNEQIKRSLQALQKQGVSIIVRTRDSLVTVNSLAENFDLAPESLRVIPFDLHAKFDDCTKYSSRGDGSVACSGTFSSFAGALITAKKVMHSIILSSSSVFTGLFLAVVLSMIFAIFGGSAAFTSTNILLYNGFFFLAMMLMQGVKRY